MRIIACIKQIGYIYDPTAIDLTTGDIDPEKMVSMLNPYDEIAVEEALRIKETVGDSEITIITVGGPETEKALRYAFAMGVDRMIRIDDQGSDQWLTALMLAAAIESIGYDLILCGKNASDGNGSQVGSFVAELLSLPQVSGIVEINLTDQGSKAIVERYLGKGDRDEIMCELPALFTVETGLNDPRYPTLLNRLKAEKAEVETLDPAELSIRSYSDEGMTEIIKFSQPRPKPRKSFTPDSTLSATDRLKMMMSGGAGGGAKSDSDVLEGSPDELARHVIAFLKQEKILVENDDK